MIDFEEEVDRRLKNKENPFDICIDREALICLGKLDRSRNHTGCPFCISCDGNCDICILEKYFCDGCLKLLTTGGDEDREEESMLYIGILQFVKDCEEGKYEEVEEHINRINEGKDCARTKI